MPLNPFQYDAIIPYIDDHYNKAIRPNLKSKKIIYRKSLEKWSSLTHDEKVEAIQIVEEMQSLSIVKAIMKGQKTIAVSRIGNFRYDLGKYYYHNNKEELKALTKEERIIRIGKYKKEHRPIYKARHNGKVFSIRKAIAEG